MVWLDTDIFSGLILSAILIAAVYLFIKLWRGPIEKWAQEPQDKLYERYNNREIEELELRELLPGVISQGEKRRNISLLITVVGILILGYFSAHYGKVTATCNDNSNSYSHHASGTCSNHGGVSHWINYPSDSNTE